MEELKKLRQIEAFLTMYMEDQTALINQQQQLLVQRATFTQDVESSRAATPVHKENSENRDHVANGMNSDRQMAKDGSSIVNTFSFIKGSWRKRMWTFLSYDNVDPSDNLGWHKSAGKGFEILPIKSVQASSYTMVC